MCVCLYLFIYSCSTELGQVPSPARIHPVQIAAPCSNWERDSSCILVLAMIPKCLLHIWGNFPTRVFAALSEGGFHYGTSVCPGLERNLRSNSGQKRATASTRVGSFFHFLVPGAEKGPWHMPHLWFAMLLGQHASQQPESPTEDGFSRGSGGVALGVSWEGTHEIDQPGKFPEICLSPSCTL